MTDEVNPTSNTTPSPAPTTAPTSTFDIPPALNTLLTQNTEQSKALGAVLAEAQLLRQEKSALEQALAEVKGKVPGDDFEAVSKEELRALKKYRQLAKDPTELETHLTAFTQTQQELSQLKRELTLRDVAELLDWKPSILSQIQPLANATMEIRQDNGKKVAVVLGADGAAIPLREYVETNLADFLPALAKSSPTTAIPRLDEGSKTADPLSALVENFLATMNKAKVRT